jgi:hypothetical protein
MFSAQSEPVTNGASATPYLFVEFFNLGPKTFQLFNEARRYTRSIRFAGMNDDGLLTHNVLNRAEVFAHELLPACIEVVQLDGVIYEVVQHDKEVVA